MQRPIPKEILHEPPAPEYIDEPFVILKETAHLKIRMQYPLLGFKAGVKTCALRKTPAEMLLKASEDLPEGTAFVIWDAWRPFALQKELFESYSDDIIRDFHLENMDEKKRVEFISQFVADPVNDRLNPPAHTTGAAVDLTVENEAGEIDFGTGFDAFTDRTGTRWYEEHDPDNPIAEERRKLYWLMIDHGFTNLSSEWWHYEYGDRNWSSLSGKPACYSGKFEESELEIQS